MATTKTLFIARYESATASALYFVLHVFCMFCDTYHTLNTAPDFVFIYIVFCSYYDCTLFIAHG